MFSLANNDGWAEKRELKYPEDGAADLAKRLLGKDTGAPGLEDGNGEQEAKPPK